MGQFRPPILRPTRRLIALTLTVAPTAAWAACQPKRVLFVCPAGTVKSSIAREVLRGRAQAEGLRVEIASRGLNPEEHVSPQLAANLRRDGIDPAREPTVALSDADVRRADVVVAFDEAAEAPLLKGARAWLTPSWNADYAAAKADLTTRMDALMGELRAGGCR